MEDAEVYFSIGKGVAGLGIFLMVPEFLTPVYVFRLRVLGTDLRALYAMVILGFLVAVVAALSSHFPESVPALLRIALFWEAIAGLLYATPFTALGLVYMFPARARPGSITKYVRAGALLLAASSENDRVEFAADILANIKRLIRIADLPQRSIPPLTRLMLRLRNRTPNDVAGSAKSFLHLLADPDFCRTLVTRLPWDAARILNAFSTEQPTSDVGRAFVHQIIRQSLIAAETNGAKEEEWREFSDAPALSQSAFGDTFLNRNYLPWEGITAADMKDIDAGLMERVARAARLTIDEIVAGRFSDQSYNVAHLQENFEAISRRLTLLKKTGADAQTYANILGRSVTYIVDATRRYCRSLSASERAALYADSGGGRGHSTLNAIVELAIAVLENTAYEFSGFDDPFWTMAGEIWDSILPRFDAEGPGVDPLQQRFILKLVEKTEENLEGYYSPLPRQALAVIGPYAAKKESPERTAFKLCRDLFYRAFQEFPAFEERDPKRAKTFLPNNVRYEPGTGELVHRYSFGGEDRTRLAALSIPDISLDADVLVVPA